MRAGTKAAQKYIEEQTKRVQWAAEAAQAAGGVVANLPKVDLPKITLPKVSLPDVPKITLPKVSLPDLSNVPGLGLVSGAGAAAVSAVQRGDLPKITLPDVSKVTLPPLPGLDVVSGAASVARGEMPKANIPQPLNDLGGWVSQGIDSIIGARDRSYEIGIEHIGAGNLAGGGQFAATAAADVILPLDLLDAGNKWMTGRGDQIDGELALWAAIDAVSLAAAPFTFGASYAAARAAKAGKVAAKTAKIGGEMGKSSVIRKLTGAIQGAGKSIGATRTVSKVSSVRRPVLGGTTRSTANISAAMRKQAEAAQKQYATLQKQMQQQYSKVMSALKAPKSAPTGATKGLGAAGSAAEVTGKTSRTATVLGKTGSALKYTGLGLGVGAIGLTALGALGGPAQEVPGGEDPMDQIQEDPFNLGDDSWLPDQDGEEPWWTLPDLPGYDTEWPEYDPTDPGYPDPLGFEPYAQAILDAISGIPVIGGVAEEANKRGLALPAIIGAIILVVLIVAYLRSKKGKAMIGGAKKKVSGAAKSAKKAVGA
ncbi:hypothetical protein R6Y95_06200 [Methanoculleus palmolei]|uniref:Uncharacterized protein n=1 Tax=Methanoculleus palmolei TaxID=72612 RepID=A0ABD8A6A8_9EURY|nr:hypothetical protein R6Y95_06200 [Methanoculleus palmolei]